MTQRQITTAPYGHLLTNAGVWTPDGAWICYDIRSDAAGAMFDGTRIERVEVATGRVEVLYESRDGACCGVVTASPVDDRVVFILGPEHPTADWSYGPARRRGVIVRCGAPGAIEPLDACDLVSPYTPGGLRGGTHVHQFSPDGRMVSFTYEDAILEAAAGGAGHERNLRAVGVSVCGRPVIVPRSHPRNHDGGAWSVLVTDLDDERLCGSDAISRACEEAWIGTAGYRRPDGSQQRRALAFQGTVATPAGEAINEVFVVDLPDADEQTGGLDAPASGPLAGTPTTRPRPPAGVVQRRLTFTAGAVHPGIQGPRHWLRSSPDGERIAYLARDEIGVVQLFTVSPRGGEPRPLTRLHASIESAFTWSPAGDRLACVIDGSVSLVDARDGEVVRLAPNKGEPPPRPEACVFSPDGRRVAYVRRVESAAGEFNQLFTVDVPD